MSKQNFDTKLAVLENLSQEVIKAPAQPVDVTTQEAENLFIWKRFLLTIYYFFNLIWQQNIFNNSSIRYHF